MANEQDSPDGFEPVPDYLGSEPEQPYVFTPGRPRATMLPFDRLFPRDFERLCYRLILCEAPEIKGCHLYGVSGEEQHGIDIVGVKPTQPLQRPSYYQCKNVKSFSGSDLDDAVKKFETGAFGAAASELILIVRAPSKTNLIDAYLRQRARLATNQIDLDLWTEEQLKEKLDYQPGIVEKFFGPAWADEFCIRATNQYKSSVLAALTEAAKTDPVLAVANDRSAGFQSHRSQNIYGDWFNKFSIRNQEVIIEANLPIGRSPLASCLILLRQQSASAVQIVLSHSEMIRDLFAGHGSGASEHRGFYRYRLEAPRSGVMISIASVRINVSNVVYGHLCEAVDGLFSVFEEALVQLDRDWESEGYQFSALDDGKTVVLLGELPYSVWQEINMIANPRRTQEVQERLPGLRTTLHSLRVWTDERTPSMDAGHHLSIWRGAIQDTEIWNGDSHLSVGLFWQPPDQFHNESTEARGTRGYWGCETAVNWIRSELITSCLTGQTSTKGTLATWLSGRGSRERPKDNYAVLYPFYSKKIQMMLPLPLTFTATSLLDLLERLWAFADYISWKKQFPATVLLSIYAALRFSLRHVDLPYLGYIINKLDLCTARIKDQRDLISEISNKAEAISASGHVSSGRVELGIRGLKEVINHGATLNAAELGKIAELLEPLAAEHDQQIRLQLHVPRVI
jgi:hypothetical protein